MIYYHREKFSVEQRRRAKSAGGVLLFDIHTQSAQGFGSAPFSLKKEVIPMLSSSEHT